MADKIKIAQYWAGACGGCDVALLDIDERILEVAAIADIVFWPIATDFKIKDVEAMEDGNITITFFNGCLRNDENVHIAKLLRQKSQILIAFGSCATHGGVIGLANTTHTKDILNTVYTENGVQSNVNPEGTIPQTSYAAPEGELTIPTILDTVKTVDQVVDVDYYMPGCPPTRELLDLVINAVAAHVSTGAELPPKGSVIASEKTLCEECPREKSGKLNVKKLYRPHEKVPEDDKCLLEQGILCVGPATRAGCLARCIDANMPCRGCMGPTSAVVDQGGSMLSAISSILDFNEEEAERSDAEMDALVEQIVDPLGSFYRFSMAKSILRRSVTERGGE